MLGTASLVIATIALSPVDTSRVSTLAKEEIFAPEKFFAATGDEDILTARYLPRDGLYPAYAIAVRYGDCIANSSGGCDHRLDVRMLRHRNSGEAFDHPVEFLGRMVRANVRHAVGARRFARRDSGLDWLATDTIACAGAFEAIEAVRKSTWTPAPDRHLRVVDDAEIWMHIPVYEVAMGDWHSRFTYRGPPYANRPSGALHALIDKLDPCWKPSPSEPPWARGTK